MDVGGPCVSAALEDIVQKTRLEGDGEISVLYIGRVGGGLSKNMASKRVGEASKSRGDYRVLPNDFGVCLFVRESKSAVKPCHLSDAPD